MIWIISGPTSAGKSTFIMSPRCSELTGVGPGVPIIWPSTAAELDGLGSTDAIFHYNILRQPELNRLNRRRARSAVENAREDTLRGFQFDRHAPWIKVVRSPQPKKAVVLVVSKETLLQRMSQVRPKEQPELRGETRNYSHNKWPGLVETVDLAALYRDWLQELRNNSIPYVLVDSNKDTYPIIEDEDALEAIVNGRVASSTNGEPSQASPAREESSFSREDIVNLLQERDFGYHRIELPYDLHTRGRDRGETRDLILPESLAGKSVFDVGSAYGYFCFEAEARGASRVVGVELEEDRFRDALLLKEIKQSKVEFIQRDIARDPLDEHFDYVLLLNVLHHLHEPVRVMRQLARITRERLVIEFPTLEDRRFQKSLDTQLPSQSHELPLIGVCSMHRGGGLTFMFTPSAIQRILLDHEPLFADVAILPSPTPGRAIALCSKNVSEHGESGNLRKENRRRHRDDRRRGDAVAG